MITLQERSLGLLLLLFAPASVALASNLNLAQVFVTPSSAGGTGPFSQTVQQPGVISIGGSATAPSVPGVMESGDGSAYVDYGTMKLFSSFSASGTASSNGAFGDDLTFTDPSVITGTILDVTYSVWVNGALIVDLSGVGEASWLLKTSIGSNVTDLLKSGTKGSPESGSPGYTGDPLGVLYFATGQVQSGLATQLGVSLDLSVSTGFDPSLNPGSATANFLNTLEWGGIQSVTLGGNPVSYTLSSSSGTNWQQSFITDTPEPSSGILALGAIALLYTKRRFH